MTDDTIAGVPPLHMIDFSVRVDFLLAAEEVRVKKDNLTFECVRLEPGPGGAGVRVIVSDGARILTAFDEFGHVTGGPVSIKVPVWFLKLHKQAKKSVTELGLEGDDDGKLRIRGHASQGQDFSHIEFSIDFGATCEGFVSRDPEWIDWRRILPRARKTSIVKGLPCFSAAHAKDISKLTDILSPLSVKSWKLEQGGHRELCAISFAGEPSAMLFNMAIEPPGHEEKERFDVPDWI